MEINKASGDKFKPKYKESCVICGESPTVSIVDKDDKFIADLRMCGPCTFGEADALYPENW